MGFDPRKILFLTFDSSRLREHGFCPGKLNVHRMKSHALNDEGANMAALPFCH
jgi:hypothetical protein